MRRAIPRLSVLSLVLLASCWMACSHTGEEDRLVGVWEGILPLPATGEELPIAYDFRSDGLTVTVGIGENRTVTEWVSWEVHSAEGGNIVLHIHRSDGRVFASLARRSGENELILWDLGTDESTAAHVRRVSQANEARSAGAGTGSQ